MLGLIFKVACFFGIDIISKIIVSEVNQVVIKNFFYITYVKNTGAAFSMFASNTKMVLAISLVITLGIFYYVTKSKKTSGLCGYGYAMILGGALGNLFDRIVYGYVRDFLDFRIFGYNMAIFNLADTFIVLGVVVLMIDTWRNKDVRD